MIGNTFDVFAEAKFDASFPIDQEYSYYYHFSTAFQIFKTFEYLSRQNVRIFPKSKEKST